MPAAIAFVILDAPPRRVLLQSVGHPLHEFVAVRFSGELPDCGESVVRLLEAVVLHAVGGRLLRDPRGQRVVHEVLTGVGRDANSERVSVHTPGSPKTLIKFRVPRARKNILDSRNTVRRGRRETPKTVGAEARAVTADTNDPSFEEALADAVDSLRTAHPALELRESGLDPLVAVLSGPADADARADAAEVVGMLAERFPAEVAPATDALADVLSDDVVRVAVVRALGYISEEQPAAVAPHADALRGLVNAEQSAVSRNAAWALSNVARRDPAVARDAFPVFLELLSDDGQVQRHAANALAATPHDLLAEHPDALSALVGALASSSGYRGVGRALVAVAPAYGDRVSDELLDCLGAGRAAVREHAAWALVPLADEHPDLVRPHWDELLAVVREDDDQQVQNSIAAALAAVATDTPDADLLADLASLLDHDDPFVRRYGCLALGDVAVSTGNEDAIAALAAAREDDDPVVSREAEKQFADAAAAHPEKADSF